MSNGLSALRKWKKCQRKVADAVLRAVPKAKRPELKSAANALARDACSKGSRGTAKLRKRTRKSKYQPPKSMPDFSRNLLTRTPHSPYEDNWGY